MIFPLVLIACAVWCTPVQASPLSDGSLSPRVDDTVEGMYDPDLFEGDIVRTKGTRNAHPDRKWPNRRVPYAFESSVDSEARKNIQEAIKEYHARTCVKWVPRRSETAYVSFRRPSNGCNSPVGTNGRGKNTVNLGKGCIGHRTILHEMMHSIGFDHEQNRPDRDRYVTIKWNNIQDRYKFAFNLAKNSKTLGKPYDFKSVMHYEAKAYSTNGKYTIVPKDGNTAKIRSYLHLSKIDVEKINAMYGCPGFKSNWVESCKDENKNCADWARRGECKANPNFMLVTCRPSCKEC